MTACVENSSSSTATSSTSASPPVSTGSNVPERIEREPRLARPADVDVDGVLQRGALADELAVAALEVDEVPVEPGVEARGEAGGDVRRENRRAEEHGVEALVARRAGEDVHARLGQRRRERRVVRDVDLRRAVARRPVGEPAHARAGDDGGDVAAELRRLRRARRASP